jgi:hypothetical protein
MASRLPPSQRPERQGGHIFRVGQPHRLQWPMGADYNYRAGGHELRIFLPNASKAEVSAIERGRVEFGLILEPDLFIIPRFYGPDGRVVCSFDCSYQWHI